MDASPDRLLEIYLADHLAGAVAGAALARRIAGRNAGEDLRRVAAEVEEDRGTLRQVAAQLGCEPSRPKELAAWAAEKVSRLKLNGRLLHPSPLSRVVELEALSIGIAGKQALWESLRVAPGIEGRLRGVDLAELVERARRQRSVVEAARLHAAREAFAGAA